MIGQGKKHYDSFQSHYWCDGFLEIYPLYLGIPFVDQTSLVPNYLTLLI